MVQLEKEEDTNCGRKRNLLINNITTKNPDNVWVYIFSNNVINNI